MHEEARSAARSALRGPGIALIVLGALGALSAGFFLVNAILAWRQGFSPEAYDIFTDLGIPVPDETRQAIERLAPTINKIAPFYWLLSMLVSVLLAVAGYLMSQLKAWELGVTASIVAMLPCITPCCTCPCILPLCLPGIPIGIWSLFMLFDRDVRAAFAGEPPATLASPPPPPPAAPPPFAPTPPAS